MLNCLSFFMFPLFSLKWVWASARFEAFGREPVHRRLAKCDAGSFVGTSSISFASAQSAKAHPFRCASSQNRNRVAGLRFCVFCAHVGATWGCMAHPRAHTRSLPGKPHTAATRASRRRTVPAVEGCKDANRSRRYPLTLLLRQAPEPLVGAALRKNAEISLCDFQRPL